MSDKLDDVLNEEIESKNKKSKNKKKLIIRISAAALAVVGLISALVFPFGKKKNENTRNDAPTTTVTTTTQPTTTSNKNVNLKDLGNELTFPTVPTQNYGEVQSGNVNKDEIVEQNGKIYANEEEVKQAENVGSTSINLQNGSLVTDTNGKVYNTTTGYVIVDGETGETIATGSLNDSGVPEGYAWDSVLNKYLPKEEVGKYTYSDATYYDSEGNIVFEKGDIVSKEDLELAKKYFTTVKPVTKPGNTVTTQTTITGTTTITTTQPTSTKSTTTVTTTTTSNKGVVNADGTYTIHGLIFLSEADYQQYILNNGEGYVMIDGIIQPEENVNQYQKVK